MGAGPGIIDTVVKRVVAAESAGMLSLRNRHRVTGLLLNGAKVEGVRGDILADDTVVRGAMSSQDIVSDFELRAGAVIVTSGGIGGNQELVRRSWPSRLGSAPKRMLSGVPHHVDGKMIGIAEDAGARVINPDRMWHHVEGTTTGLKSGRITGSDSSRALISLARRYRRRLTVPLFRDSTRLERSLTS